MISKRVRVVIQAAGVVFSKVLGVEHPDTLASANNLGSLGQFGQESEPRAPDIPVQSSGRV